MTVTDIRLSILFENQFSIIGANVSSISDAAGILMQKQAPRY